MPDLYPDEYLKASEKFKQLSGPTAEAYKAWHTQAMNAGALDKKNERAHRIRDCVRHPL
jgi:hypothetical protein